MCQIGYNLSVKLKIIKFPNPFLRKKAKAVKKFTPVIAKLIDDKSGEKICFAVNKTHGRSARIESAPQLHSSI